MVTELWWEELREVRASYDETTWLWLTCICDSVWEGYYKRGLTPAEAVIEEIMDVEGLT